MVKQNDFGIVLSPSEDAKPVLPDRPDGSFSLDLMQSIVGGLIELVYLSGDRIMVVNEEGLLLDLEPNLTASRIAGQLIVGPALVIQRDQIR